MSAVANPLAGNPLAEVQAELAEFVHDPLGFVMCAYPWGEGDLAGEAGPREHQIRFLTELGDHLQNPETRHKPFRKSKSSGHGIGKSAEISWVAHWGLSTFEDCKVIVMAGTGDQLKTKTQPEMSKWFRLGANAELFEVNVTSIKVREPGRETTWRADFQTWSEENPQASAGAHNKGKRLIIIYDEAAGITDVIWKTQEGALTDSNTEIIWIAASQCTRSEGYFFETVFGTQKHRWRPEVIDSRTVEGVNVEEINESIALYGAASDHVRVRWLGLYPLAGEGKFIDLQLVQEAQYRSVVGIDEPLIAGVDLSWGGSDDTVIRFRRGLDARSIPPIKIRGEFTKNPAVIRERLADVLRSKYDGQPVKMMFLDNSGVGGNAGAILAGLHALGFEKRVMGINFGDQAIHDQFYALRRDEMWGEMKNWLREGGAIDLDKDLAADLQKPVLIKDVKQRVKLEPKEDMKRRLAKMGLDSSSPDDGDALALTFAMPVVTSAPISVQTPTVSAWNRAGDGSWMG